MPSWAATEPLSRRAAAAEDRQSAIGLTTCSGALHLAGHSVQAFGSGMTGV